MKPFRIMAYWLPITAYLITGFVAAVFLGVVFEIAAAIHSSGLPPFTSVLVAMILLGLFVYLFPALYRGVVGWLKLAGRWISGLFNLAD